MKISNFCFSLVMTLIIISNLVVSRKIMKKFTSKSKTRIDELPWIATALPTEEDNYLDKVISFSHEDKLQAYIGYLTETTVGKQKFPATLIIYYRGSVTLDNWLQNLKIAQTKYEDGPKCVGDCWVHIGFYKSFLKIKANFFTAYSKMIETIKKEGWKFPTEIIFTGFSMGGALTTFNALSFIEAKEKNKAAADSIYNIPDVSLITFGAPRVGNPSFADWMNFLTQQKRLKRNIRVVYKGDPVPKLPPQTTKVNDGSSSFVSKIFGIDTAKKIITGLLETRNFPYKHSGNKMSYPDTTYPVNGEREEKEAAFSQVKPVFKEMKQSDPEKPSPPIETLISNLKSNFKKHLVYTFLNGPAFWNIVLQNDK